MVKKKNRLKLKLSKKQHRRLIHYGKPVLAGLLGLLIGVAATKLSDSRRAPSNLVWAADNTVKIPKDLRAFLMAKNDCKAYRGTDSPTGVGLWGVYQVSKSQYAKIAYGCSWNLSSYVMAVKQKGSWQLIKPTEYFAPFKNGVDPSKGALPFCNVLEQYKIPKDIEPFCVKADGSAQSNESP